MAGGMLSIGVTAPDSSRQHHANRCHGEQIDRSTESEQRHRPRNRHPKRPANDQPQRQHCCHDDHQTVGPDFGQHDLDHRNRHRQQMLDRSAFTFTDHRRPAAAEKIGRLSRHDALDVKRTVACGAHRRGIDIQLDDGGLPGQQIGLEIRRDVEDETVTPRIHQRIDLIQRDLGGWFEIGLQQGPGNARRQGRAIFVHHRDGGISQLCLHAFCHDIDRSGESTP
jgi:hypothetical protein